MKLFNLALACAVSAASLATPFQGLAAECNETLPKFDNTLYCVAPSADGKGTSLYSIGAIRMLTAHSGQRCIGPNIGADPTYWSTMLEVP